MAEIRVGVDWNRDGVIFWGEDSTLDMVDVVSVNEYGLDTNTSGDPNLPGTVENLSGNFTANGFSLSWDEPVSGGTPDYYIIFYEGFPVGYEPRSGATDSFLHLYTDVEKFENTTQYLTTVTWDAGYKQDNQALPAEGLATIQVKNDERLFSPAYSGCPFNAETPLTGRVVIHVQNSSGNWELVWTGGLISILPQVTKKTPFATLVAEQGIESLRKFPQRTGILENVTSGEALEYLLTNWLPAGIKGWTLGRDRLGVSTVVLGMEHRSSIDAGVYTHELLNETWLTAKEQMEQFKSENTNTVGIVENLVELEQGLFYLDPSNNVMFRDRNSIGQIASTAGTVSIDSAALYGAYEFGDLHSLYNIITANYYPKSYETDATMYEQVEDRNISVGGTATIGIATKPEDVFKITPARITDVTLTSSGGTASTSYAINDSGNGVDVTIVNVGATELNLTKVVVTGDFLRTYDPVPVQVLDNDSIALYSKREYEIDIKECSTAVMAESVANKFLVRHRFPHGKFTQLSLNDKNTDWLSTQLGYYIGDALIVDEYQTGETGLLNTIIGIRHRWTPGLLETTFTLQEHISAYFWVLGQSALGVSTALT